MSRLFTHAATRQSDTLRAADTVEKYAFKPMDFKEPQAAATSVSHMGGTSIPIPDGARIGQTMTMNGKTYVLQETTPGKPRWHLVEGSTNKTMASPGTHEQQTQIQPQGGASGTGPSVKGEWKKQGQQQPADDTTHEQRHKHVSGNIGSAPQEVRGIIAAMHADPGYQQGGETATKSFAAEQAGGLRNWLQQNVGKQVQGGQVVNLGGGALGFSGPAGAIVVWPADAHGKHKVGYTNKTGVVTQALKGGKGGDAGPSSPSIPTGVVPPPQIVPPPQEPIEAEAVDQPSAPVKPFQPESSQPQPRIDRPQQPTPVSPPVQISDTPKASETPTEAMPPEAPTAARNVQHARTMFEEGMAAFAAEAARGLSQRGRGRWRAYTAALRSIWRDSEANARTPLFREKKPPAGSKGKKPEWQPSSAEANRDFGDTLEKDAAQTDPKRAADLKAMREHGFLDEGAYRKSLEGIVRPKQPKAAQPEEPAEPQKPFTPMSEEEQNRRMGIEPQQPAQPKPEAPAPPTAKDPWSIPPPPMSDKPPVAARTMKRMNPAKLRSYAKGFAGHIDFQHTDAGHKLIEDAIAQGHIQNPRHVRGILKTAKRLHEQGNTAEDSAQHVGEAIRRLRNRTTAEAWQHRLDDYAAEFDLTPQEFEQHAQSMYGDFRQHHEDREAAKAHLKKHYTGGRSINQDKIEEAESIRGLDAGVTQLAGMFPNAGFREQQGANETETAEHNARLAYQLLSEPAGRPPALRSEEFLKHVAEQMGSRSRDRDEPLPEEAQGAAVPFTEPGQPERYYFHHATEAAARETATPSEAQAEAGNYKKGKVRLHGLTISIENAKGSKRKPEWPPLSAHYGYINGTEGRDDDQLDVFLGPHPSGEIVYVIDQVDEAGKFDEHKAMIGWATAKAAKAAYLANYPAGWKCGEITAMTVGQFKNWLGHGNTRMQVAAQVSKYASEYDRLVERDKVFCAAAN